MEISSKNLSKYLQGEIVVNRGTHTKSYTSLCDLVHGMFPSMSSSEQVWLLTFWVLLSKYYIQVTFKDNNVPCAQEYIFSIIFIGLIINTFSTLFTWQLNPLTMSPRTVLCKICCFYSFFMHLGVERDSCFDSCFAF